jgi:nicotinamidase-related amidase
VNRALLVVDVQNEYESGALPIAFPPLPEALGNVARALDAAHAAGLPVVLVRQTDAADSRAFAAGSDRWQLHPVVRDRWRDGDHVVDKAMPSAFAGTDLDRWLRRRGVDVLTVVGFMTQNCVESTVRDAVHRGWQVEVLSDATGTVALANAAGAVSARHLHETSLVVLQSRFAAVTTTARWLAAVHGGEEPERSSLLASAAAARHADPLTC